MKDYSDWTYTMRGEAIVISKRLGIPIVLKEHDLKAAIAFIEGDQDSYYTEKAWQRQLRMYRGALAFLQAHREAER